VKVLLGIDEDGQYRSAMALLERLRFPETELTLLHVNQSQSYPVSLPSLPVFSGTEEPIEEPSRSAQIQRIATEEAEACGFDSNEIYETGSPSDRLLLYSFQLPADLVAIGSCSRAAAPRLTGSVAHALIADSTKSFLVSHGNVAPAGRLRCLFATDHSMYANRALNRFLDWAPAGIAEMTIFTAIEPRASHSESGGRINGISVDPQVIATRSSRIAENLENQGIRSHVRFGAGRPAEAILKAASELRVDLLILGARGHGFLDRIFLGSVSSAVIDRANFPVLVMRP